MVFCVPERILNRTRESAGKIGALRYYVPTPHCPIRSLKVYRGYHRIKSHDLYPLVERPVIECKAGYAVGKKIRFS